MSKPIQAKVSTEDFNKVMDAIKEACPGVIIQPSTGGAVGMTNDERLQPTELNPEMATLDCGTCNFGGDDVFTNTENTIKIFINSFSNVNGFTFPNKFKFVSNEDVIEYIIDNIETNTGIKNFN
jgi:hypothetical protein